MFRPKTDLDRVLTFIRKADDRQINEIIQALIARYGEVYPNWDVTFLSLPRNNPEERNNVIQHFLKSVK